MRGSSTRGCSGPRPQTAASTAADQGGRRCELEVGLGEDVADRASQPRLLLGRPPERVEILGREACHEQATDRAQRCGRDRTLIGCRGERRSLIDCLRAPGSSRGPMRGPSAGAPSADGRPGAAATRPARRAQGRSTGRVPSTRRARRGRRRAVKTGSARMQPEDRDVRLAGEPADLGVVVRAARDERELAAHPLGAQHGREPEDVGQRLERRAHDAQHEVRLVDQLPVALLEEAAEIDDQQVVPGTLRPLDELARLRGAEHAQIGVARERLAFGELGMRREGEDVSAPPGRDREVADRSRLPPDPVAAGPRQRGGREAEAQADGAREPRRIEQEHANRRLGTVEPADPGMGADQRGDLGGDRGPADAAREPRHRDHAHRREDVRDRDRSVGRGVRCTDTIGHARILVRLHDAESCGPRTLVPDPGQVGSTRPLVARPRTRAPGCRRACPLPRR